MLEDAKFRYYWPGGMWPEAALSLAGPVCQPDPIHSLFGIRLTHRAPGPAASRTPEQRRIEQLEKENDCLDLQKKSLVDARSTEQWERGMNTVLAQRPARLPLARACHVLGLNRITVCVHQKRAANDEPPRRSRMLSVQLTRPPCPGACNCSRDTAQCPLL